MADPAVDVDAAALGCMGLPPRSPWVRLGDSEHRRDFEAYVRAKTLRQRLGALLLTMAVLAALSGGDVIVTALAAAAVSAAMPTPAADTTQSLCAGALMCSVWLLAGMLRSTPALLCALALLQCATSHQLLLPFWPVLPSLITVVVPLAVLFIHPACAERSLASRIALAMTLALAALIHLILSYAARTVWLNEWLLQHYAPALFQEVIAERKALRKAAKLPGVGEAGTKAGASGGNGPASSAVDAEPGLVVVVGLPRSGTTYLFSLLERIHGKSGVALSCYSCLFHERCVTHCSNSVSLSPSRC